VTSNIISSLFLCLLTPGYGIRSVVNNTESYMIIDKVNWVNFYNKYIDPIQIKGVTHENKTLK